MTSAKKITAPAGFTNDLLQRLALNYIEVVREKDPSLAALLEEKRKLQNLPDKTERIRRYLALWESLSPAYQLALAGEYAKISHMSRRGRIIGTTMVVQAYNVIESTTAGSVDFVIAKCRENNVSAPQMQRFLDENAVAWFSLTGHPTNPNTVDYYIAETMLCRVLANPVSTNEELKIVLRHIRDTPIVGPRKTPLDEAAETLTTLNVIFDAALEQKKLFEQALDKFGYSAEGVSIRYPLIRPSTWTLGDGDGNPAITGDALAAGIKLHRASVAMRYEEVKNSADLPYLKQCFGNGFGTIDIRHNAHDFMVVVERLAAAAGLVGQEKLAQLSLIDQEQLLADWLEDSDMIEKLRAVKSEHLIGGEHDEDGHNTVRILEHLRVMAAHSDMCEKVILAETTDAAQVMAALLTLRVTGHEIANDKTRLDLTILSESVADLVKIGNLLEDLLENPIFRAQVVYRGRLLAMIAKSDTTRLDGRGEAEYSQYEAAVDIYRVIDKMKRRYGDLEGVLTSVMNGGGHALQRGGGRVTEIPAVHGIAAAEALATDIGPSTLTIQGNQQGILFTPGRTALGTLEALAAQNLYSKAGIHGEMPPSPLAKNVNKHFARADSWVFAKRAGEAFDRLAKNNPSIDELLIDAPWVSMKSGNASSRPAKRGEAPMEIGVTPGAAKGNRPKALNGRAISGERLTAHADIPVYSMLGLAEAMEAVRAESEARFNPDKYGDPLHHLYRAYKIHRDGVRATINAAAMADFDLAWLMLRGREAPPIQERQKLAADFDIDAGNLAEVTLCFLEQYFLRTEKLAYEMVAATPAGDNFMLGDALRLLWPELSENVQLKNRNAEFARVVEALRNREFIEHPEIPLDETQFRITQAIYSAADLIDAPVGIVATRTRLEPALGNSGKGMLPQSYREEDILDRLVMPPALAG